MCFMYIDRIYFSDSGTKISMNDIIVKAAGYSLKVKKKNEKNLFLKKCLCYCISIHRKYDCKFKPFLFHLASSQSQFPLGKWKCSNPAHRWHLCCCGNRQRAHNSHSQKRSRLKLFSDFLYHQGLMLPDSFICAGTCNNCESKKNMILDQCS